MTIRRIGSIAGTAAVVLIALQGCKTTAHSDAGNPPASVAAQTGTHDATAVYKTYRQAVARDEADRHLEAIALYSQVIDSNDEELVLSSLINRARLHEITGQPQKSINDFLRYVGLEAAPSHEIDPAVWVGLARGHYLLGQTADARNYVDKALNKIYGQIAKEPSESFNFHLLVGVGAMLSLLGQHDMAIDALSEAMDRSAGNTFADSAVESRAVAYIRRGDMEKALRDLNLLAAVQAGYVKEARRPFGGDASQASYRQAMKAYQLRAFAKARTDDKLGALADLFLAKDMANHLTDPVIAGRILRTIRQYRDEDRHPGVVSYQGFGIENQMTKWNYKVRIRRTIKRNRGSGESSA